MDHISLSAHDIASGLLLFYVLYFQFITLSLMSIMNYVHGLTWAYISFGAIEMDRIYIPMYWLVRTKR